MSDNLTLPKWEIIQGDALSLLRSYPAGSFDAIITDPPYASGGRTQAEKNTCKYIVHIRSQNLCCPVHLQIPKVPAVCIEKKTIVQIPVKVHPFDRELYGLLVILLPQIFYVYFQTITPMTSAYKPII